MIWDDEVVPADEIVTPVDELTDTTVAPVGMLAAVVKSKMLSPATIPYVDAVPVMVVGATV